MTTTTVRRRPAPRTVEDMDLRHYDVQAAADLLGVSRRWLAGQAAARAIDCTYVAGKLRFTAAHIRAISRAGEVNPDTYGR